MKNILKDLYTGVLPWTALPDLFYWRLFVVFLDDEVSLIGEK